MVKENNKKIKVLVIGMSNNKGGVETYIKNVFDAIDKRDFEFHFCSAMEPGENYHHLESQGAIIHMIPASRHNFIEYSKFWNVFFKQNNFDVVINNACDIVSIDILKFAKKHGVSVRILHSHSSGNQIEMNLLHKSQERINRKNLDVYSTAFWACSEIAGNWMFDNREYQIIKNGINVNRFLFSNDKRENLRKQLGIDNSKCFCMIGRLSAEKNPIKAIEIFESYYKNNKDSKLVFVGEGSLKAKLQTVISEKKLDDSIILLGARSDVPDIMMASDCLLMTSDFEGLPFVLVEAQCTGLPCVVIDNVSKESALTDLVTFVESDSGLDKWSEVLDEALNRNIDRSIYPEQIKKTGFDITETASFISEFIKGKLNDKDNN